MDYLEKKRVGEKLYVVISGDSSEDKPIDDWCDGSVFVESDTCKAFFFNAKTKTWKEVGA